VITRIEATRYRCFDKLNVDLGEFRVIVGANGSARRHSSTSPSCTMAGCVDPAFLRIRDVLRAWFPAEDA
jgi:predicted ATP-binding protein involved in virulence